MALAQEALLTCYCRSKTEVLVTVLPVESAPVAVTVRVLPSAATAMRPVMVTLPARLLANVSVRSSTRVYDRASSVESPVTG